MLSIENKGVRGKNNSQKRDCCSNFLPTLGNHHSDHLLTPDVDCRTSFQGKRLTDGTSLPYYYSRYSTPGVIRYCHMAYSGTTAPPPLLFTLGVLQLDCRIDILLRTIYI